MNTKILIYILIMAAVSYGIRVLPLTLFRKPIRNTFLTSFLYYVPYVTLSVMTFPAILYLTDSVYTGLITLAAGLAVAWFTRSLILTATACCVLAFGAGLLFS